MYFATYGDYHLTLDVFELTALKCALEFYVKSPPPENDPYGAYRQCHEDAKEILEGLKKGTGEKD